MMARSGGAFDNRGGRFRGGLSLGLVTSVLGLMLSDHVTPVACAQSFGPTQQACPPRFQLIGRKCYFFSKDEATWQDSHFLCLNLNSTLATVTRSRQELHIRQYLNRYSSAFGKYERWIGGRFNWKQSKWEWGASGKPLDFHGFSRMNAKLKEEWKWHCIIIDPERHNKWGAKNCVQKKRYVCQTPTLNYMIMKKNLKKEFDDIRSCDDPEMTAYKRELCIKFNGSKEIAPGFLAKKPKKKAKKPKVHDFICPPHMIIVGRKCYYFSTEAKNWNDAYWACRDNKTKLATIHTKLQDDILRGFLNVNFVGHHERWIGGMYDWKQNKWRWAISGQELKYRNIDRSITERDNTYHCLTMDPSLNHQWNSRNRFDLKHYICQVKPKTLIKYEKPFKMRPPDATVVIQAADKDGRFRKDVGDSPTPTVPTLLNNITNTG